MVTNNNNRKLNKALALWAHPRARSSAMGRMICERGDFRVMDEPFMDYYYFSDERVSKRRTDVEPTAKYRFDAVLKNVLQEVRQRAIFVKDHAYHVVSRADSDFLSHFQNTFLIRHPAQSLPSLYARMPDFTLQETGYAESFRLFELARQCGDETPVVIDADDLVESPARTIRAYCQATGIRFLQQSLSWKSGIPQDLSADWGGWYSHLEQSRGFARQANPDYIPVEENPDTRHAYQYCLPYYQKLYEYRLRIPASDI